MPDQRNKADNVPSFTIDSPLLHAVMAVILMSIAAFILTLMSSPLSTQENIIFSFVIVTFLFSLVYAAYELFTALERARRERHALTGVCTSALLGALLLGITSFTFTMLTASGFLLNLIALTIILCSLTSLFIVNVDALVALIEQSFSRRKAIRSDRPELPSSPVPLLPPPPLPALSAPANAERRTFKEQRFPIASRESLPPLFQHDILYQPPQPRNARFFAVAKEREDACVISDNETRFALSDGAGGSSLPRPWAALLGQQWKKEPLRGNYAAELSSWLEEPRQNWVQWVERRWYPEVNERNQLTGDHPVQPEEVERILERGAFATFLGVEVNHQQRTVSALALGDTCLFILRSAASHPSFESMPVRNSQDFNNSPPLLSSRRGDSVNDVLPYVEYYSNQYEKGDLLLMATDALAQWILWQWEQGLTEWHALLRMQDKQQFASFVEKQRREGCMDEDDTTLIVIPL